MHTSDGIDTPDDKAIAPVLETVALTKHYGGVHAQLFFLYPRYRCSRSAMTQRLRFWFWVRCCWPEAP
jgi:hypothetical protein